MPGFLLNVGATILCPHGAKTTITPTQTRVVVGGEPVATVSDIGLVAGCPFTTPVPKPQPCITARWTTSASKILIGGQPALLQDSMGICQSAEQIPQGPPNVTVTQVRVKGI